MAARKPLGKRWMIVTAFTCFLMFVAEFVYAVANGGTVTDPIGYTMFAEVCVCVMFTGLWLISVLVGWIKSRTSKTQAVEAEPVEATAYEPPAPQEPAPTLREPEPVIDAVETTAEDDAELKARLERELEAMRRQEERERRERWAREALSDPVRRMHSPVRDGEPFPLGVRGLTPLETSYPKGGSTMCWIFADGESQAAVEPTVGVINAVLDEATRLVGINLGMLHVLEFRPEMRAASAVRRAGETYAEWGFTRVEYHLVTPHGNLTRHPITLRFESDALGDRPGTFSGRVLFGQDGEPDDIKVTSRTSYGEHYAVSARATKRERMRVKTVERFLPSTGDWAVIYG